MFHVGIIINLNVENLSGYQINSDPVAQSNLLSTGLLGYMLTGYSRPNIIADAPQQVNYT